MKLTDKQRDFIKLIGRSKDAGNGWREVSKLLWPLTKMVSEEIPELIEVGVQRVRLTNKGKTVLEYI